MPYIRLFEPSDSIEAITLLLHRAYAPLGGMDLNYTAVDQSPNVTANRIRRGTCCVATDDSNFVGTIDVLPTNTESDCLYFTKPGIVCANQLPLRPGFRTGDLGANSCDAATAAWSGFN